MLTEEREREIREESRLEGGGGMVEELLAEIDRLRDELEQYTHTNQVQATVISELKAENEKLKQGFMMIHENERLKDEVDRLRIRKDGAYTERNKCVTLLAKMAMALGLKAGKAIHDQNDKDWEDDWRNIIYIDLPNGQTSWHFHDSHAHLLKGLPVYDGVWDGHSTENKYLTVLHPGGFSDYKNLKLENAGLAKERDDWKQMFDSERECHKRTLATNAKLTEENERLQTFYDTHAQAVLDTLANAYNVKCEKVSELMKERDELKRQCDAAVVICRVEHVNR